VAGVLPSFGIRVKSSGISACPAGKADGKKVQLFLIDLRKLVCSTATNWCNLLVMRLIHSVACVLAFLTISLTAAAGTKVFDVRQFGARGDGKTFDTEAIQKALDECGQANGGTVKISRGTYLSRPLTVRARTTILLEEGATLLASPTQSDFLKGGGDWLKATNSGAFIPLISGKDLVDVTFTGKGTIDGNGAVWWEEAEKARQKVSGYTLPRPNLVTLNRCKNVRLENITLQNSPKFHFVPAECEDVVISNVTILAPVHAANTDAIDPSNCRNVTITRCLIDVGDDNVAIKSGKKVEGREFGCENIFITDCVFKHGHGMSIGSESVGGVHNVIVKNCRFEGTENGIRIKSRRGRGGVVDGLICTDNVMTNVFPALSIACYYQDSSQAKFPKDDPAQPVTDTTPMFRNIRITNLTATSTKNAGVIVGLPESLVSNVVLENVHITAQTGLTIANAKGIQLKNVTVSVKEGPPVTVENAQVEGLEQANQKH
jgi:polygalacturonase